MRKRTMIVQRILSNLLHRREKNHKFPQTLACLGYAELESPQRMKNDHEHDSMTQIRFALVYS
jgi:hypothetical protein